MYLFLESISEFLDKFSLVIVGGLIGIVVIFLVWSKMPKLALRPKRKLRKIERRQLKLILSLAGLSLIWGSGGLSYFFEIGAFILAPALIGLGCVILYWVL